MGIVYILNIHVLRHYYVCRYISSEYIYLHVLIKFSLSLYYLLTKCLLERTPEVGRQLDSFSKIVSITYL